MAAWLNESIPKVQHTSIPKSATARTDSSTDSNWRPCGASLFDTGVIVRTLRTVPTIFGASARFYGQQTAHLNFIRGVELAVGLLRFKYQIHQRTMVNY